MDHGFNVSRNFVLFATHDLAEGKFTSNKLSEADAACAMNAPGHGSFDQWTELLVFDSTLVLHKATLSVAIHG